GLTKFHWNASTIAPLLRDIHFNQGLLLGKSDYEDTKQATLNNLLSNIIYSGKEVASNNSVNSIDAKYMTQILVRLSMFIRTHPRQIPLFP
ncbi:protein of unknown function (DUF4172), partial [Photorhabdus khanii NC19]